MCVEDWFFGLTLHIFCSGFHISVLCSGFSCDFFVDWFFQLFVKCTLYDFSWIGLNKSVLLILLVTDLLIKEQTT
jgi:hypothetical protein